MRRCWPQQHSDPTRIRFLGPVCRSFNDGTLASAWFALHSSPMSGEVDPQSPQTSAFHKLTPLAVAQFITQGGRGATGMFQILNSYENRVYALMMDDGSQLIGKFYRPGRWSDEAIIEEHQFLAKLEDAGVLVAPPLDLPDGSTLGLIHGIRYALFERIPGREPQELDPDQLERIGHDLAMIHSIGRNFHLRHRPVFTLDAWAETNLQFLLDHGTIPEEFEDAYEDAVDELLDAISPLFVELPVQPIHGDCHLGNLIWTHAGPYFLDFDDMVLGPPVQDIWLIAPSYDSDGVRQRQVLLDAYQCDAPFDSRQLDLVEPLRALRFIHFSAWIARRWSDPYFRHAFDYFGSAEYWRNEVADLHEQIRRIG